MSFQAVSRLKCGCKPHHSKLNGTCCWLYTVSLTVWKLYGHVSFKSFLAATSGALTVLSHPEQLHELVNYIMLRRVLCFLGSGVPGHPSVMPDVPFFWARLLEKYS